MIHQRRTNIKTASELQRELATPETSQTKAKGRMQLEYLYASTVTSPGITHSNALVPEESQTI